MTFRIFVYIISLFAFSFPVSSPSCHSSPSSQTCLCSVAIYICLNIQETDTFTSTTTGESFKINHKLNCDNNCLIYLLTCKCCGKQYVGETTDEFRLRWNNYKSNDRKNARNETCMQEHLFEHFKSEDHSGFLGNVSITLIDKTDGKDPKRRENYWMRTLKTYAPFGLNIEDSV